MLRKKVVGSYFKQYYKPHLIKWATDNEIKNLDFELVLVYLENEINNNFTKHNRNFLKKHDHNYNKEKNIEEQLATFLVTHYNNYNHAGIKDLIVKYRLDDGVNFIRVWREPEILDTELQKHIDRNTRKH